MCDVTNNYNEDGEQWLSFGNGGGGWVRELLLL